MTQPLMHSYASRLVVEAAPIVSLIMATGAQQHSVCVFVTPEGHTAMMDVPNGLCDRYHAVPGDYLVVDHLGHVSAVPKKVFEAGFDRLLPATPNSP